MARAEPTRGPVIVGTVTGEVAREEVAVTGPGRRMLLQATAVVAVVALLVTVVVARALPAAVVLLACGLPVLLQGLVHLLRPRATPDRVAAGRHAPTTERWRFRVVEPSGRGVNCVLTGEPTGGPVRRGDVVEVYGRASRTDQVRIREVVVVADQRSVRGRPDPGFVLTRVADVATVVLAAAGLVGVVLTMVVP